MSFIQALLLGIIQGITEFLPVSSSGHLAIIENLFKIETDTGLLFNTIIHLGTLTAIFIAFRQDVKSCCWRAVKAFMTSMEMCGPIFTIGISRMQNGIKRLFPIITESFCCCFLYLPFLLHF